MRLESFHPQRRAAAHAVALLLFSALLIPAAHGQNPPSSGASSNEGWNSPSGAGSTSGTSSANSSRNYPGRSVRDSQRTQSNPRSRPRVVLSGKVVLDSGDPAPVDTLIQRLCQGQPIPEGYVNSKGEFHLALGQDSASIADASAGVDAAAGGSTAELQQLAGCEIRAFLPGYQSTSISLATHRILQSASLGTLVLSRIAGVDGYTISATTLQAPRDARKHYERGVKEMEKGKPANALASFDKAIAAYPAYALAHYARGQALEALQRLDEATASYRNATAQDPQFVLPTLRLAAISAQRGEWPQAESFAALVIRKNPFHFPLAYYLHTISCLRLERYPEAETSAREAKKLDTEQLFPRLDYFLAVALQNQGKYGEAAAALSQFLQSNPEGIDRAALESELQRLKELARKSPTP